MARALKAVMINPDRTAKIYYIKAKNKIGPDAFKLPKVDEVYIIDPDYSLTTITRRGFIPFKFTTYYYARNIPKPLPFPKFDDFLFNTENAQQLAKDVDADPSLLENANKKKFTELIKKYAPTLTFYQGISAKELGILFNPALYAMIAKSNKSKREDLMFYLQAGTAVGVGFLCYYITQNLSKAIATMHGG